MISIAYVSQSLIPAEDMDREIEAILSVSLARNAALGVTGALLFTGGRFAQAIEGPGNAARAVIASISADERHCDVTIIEDREIENRRFDGWSMRFLGHSTFASHTIERALAEHGTEEDYALRTLIRLLQELGRWSAEPATM